MLSMFYLELRNLYAHHPLSVHIAQLSMTSVTEIAVFVYLCLQAKFKGYIFGSIYSIR